jgi:hypothetical protein
MQSTKYLKDRRKGILSFTMGFREINKNNKSQNKLKEKCKAQIATCVKTKSVQELLE